MTDTHDLEFDDPDVADIGEDQLPDDDQEFAEPPDSAAAAPVEPVSA